MYFFTDKVTETQRNEVAYLKLHKFKCKFKVTTLSSRLETIQVIQLQSPCSLPLQICHHINVVTSALSKVESVARIFMFVLLFVNCCFCVCGINGYGSFLICLIFMISLNLFRCSIIISTLSSLFFSE